MGKKMEKSMGKKAIGNGKICMHSERDGYRSSDDLH